MTEHVAENAPTGGFRIRTFRQVLETEPYKSLFTAPALRALIFDAEDRKSASGKVIKGNGLAKTILRIGRRVYFNLDELDRWLLSHQGLSSTRGKQKSPTL